MSQRLSILSLSIHFNISHVSSFPLLYLFFIDVAKFKLQLDKKAKTKKPKTKKKNVPIFVGKFLPPSPFFCFEKRFLFKIWICLLQTFRKEKKFMKFWWGASDWLTNEWMNLQALEISSSGHIGTQLNWLWFIFQVYYDNFFVGI